MITLREQSQKEWAVFNDEEEVLKIDAANINVTLTNKYEIVATFINNMSKILGDEFDTWLVSFLDEYNETGVELKLECMLRNVPIIQEFVNQYFKKKDFDFGKFVDMTKVKKSTILFDAREIEIIIKLSSCLKIYSLISNNKDLKLDPRRHKKVYSKFAEEAIENKLMTKLFTIIQSKTFRYSLTDRYMWDYIKMVQCKSIDVHVIEIFNFIMNSILILCEEDRNPITYFVGVIDESINWFLRSVYKGSIIYEDSISTEDIQGINVDNLKTYCYNDTLGRLKGVAYEKVYHEIERSVPPIFDSESRPDKVITEFQTRMSELQVASPMCNCLVFPLLSKVTNIPYSHFKTLSPEHATILSIYLHMHLKKVFKSNFSTLFSLLDYYPRVIYGKPQEIPKATTYTLKSAMKFMNYQNNAGNFFGFKTWELPRQIICFYVGRISRLKFNHIITNIEVPGIPLSKIELDMISFYPKYFGNKFENEMQILKEQIVQDF